MKNEALEIQQTKDWVEQIIIGLNFCPFAKKEMVNDTIRYKLSHHKKLKLAVTELFDEIDLLQATPAIETSLLIYSDGFQSFEQYLALVDYANEVLADSAYDGVFQLASFHPDYYFEGAEFDDPENYTNRSPYPTLHIIREASLTRVLSTYKNPENIPENNISLAQSKGNEFFERILNKIKHT